MQRLARSRTPAESAPIEAPPTKENTMNTGLMINDGKKMREATAEYVVKSAIAILTEKLRQDGHALSAPSAVRDYLRLTLAGKEHEVFTVLFLDAQHRLIAAEEMFRGTLTQTSVYPREVVKAALAHNACCVIFAHNHPSGIAEPSRADEALTIALKKALALVDVRVMDHFVVGNDCAVSFAEKGLL